MICPLTAKEAYNHWEIAESRCEDGSLYFTSKMNSLKGIAGFSPALKMDRHFRRHHGSH